MVEGQNLRIGTTDIYKTSINDGSIKYIRLSHHLNTFGVIDYYGKDVVVI